MARTKYAGAKRKKTGPRIKKRVRVVKRTRNPVLSARAKAYVKPAPKVTAGKRKRESAISSAKRAKPGTTALKAAVVRNAKSIARIKTSAWGKYQTANSVLGPPPGGVSNGAIVDGGQSFTVSADLPVIHHLTNIHSHPDMGAPHFYKRKDKTAAGADVEMSETGVVDEFTSLGQFTNNGVLQKTVLDRTTGVNGTPRETPYPNGEKIKHHGTDLTFEISGYMRNTTIDFWIVQEKPQAKLHDPWNAQTNSLLAKARHLPYTLQEFARVSERMSFEKIPSSYKIVGHKRAFINNMNDSAVDANHLNTIKSVTGERRLEDLPGGTVTWGKPATYATTKPKQYVHIKYCPHTGVYPLKRAIGEAVDAKENMKIKPNKFEVRSIGTMAWDNFDPKALTLTLTLTGRRP